LGGFNRLARRILIAKITLRLVGISQSAQINSFLIPMNGMRCLEEPGPKGMVQSLDARNEPEEYDFADYGGALVSTM